MSEESWLASTTRWIQLGFLITSTMLVGRASRIILVHEYDSAKLRKMHKTNWGTALDDARAKHDIAAYGDDVWFILVVMAWALIAVILVVKFAVHEKRRWCSHSTHIAVVRVGLATFLTFGLYLFVMSVLIAADFAVVECSLDHSARHLVDADETDQYVTCGKQDYTQDLLDGVFTPLFILLTLELLLVAGTHWTVEIGSAKAALERSRLAGTVVKGGIERKESQEVGLTQVFNKLFF